MRVKRKARQQGQRDKKKQKTIANAAFDALTEEQRALCIATATRISATSATNATIQPAPGPTRTVFVVNATAYAAEPNRLPMPIAI